MVRPEETLGKNCDSDRHPAAGDLSWQGRSCSRERLLNVGLTRILHESCWPS